LTIVILAAKFYCETEVIIHDGGYIPSKEDPINNQSWHRIFDKPYAAKRTENMT
jgi:hypothetical protein